MSDPRKPYRPEPGDNFGRDYSPLTSEESTYADPEGLQRDLATLIAEVESLNRLLEDDMYSYSLRVDPGDLRLVEAHRREWPDSLSEPGDRISYRYYKALRLRDTTSASYIRKRYEEAARDVTGSSSIDLIPLANAIRSEALLVQEFLNAYTDRVDDSSEQRALESFQDWVQSGLRYTRQFRAFHEAGEETEEFLPEAEIERATPEESKQGQAVFKVQLNGHNNSIVKDLEFLQKNFSEYASVFYGKFLGPALRFRLDVGRRSLPTGSVLQGEIEKASKNLEGNLKMALADQMRRRFLFENKVESIFDTILERNRVRSYIVQLAAKGKPMPVTGPRVMVKTEEKPEEVEYWISFSPPEEDEETKLKASHGLLDDLEDPEAHPQYLLRTGGKVSGDIELSDGVKVGGIVPGAHRHTGEDGSERIHGSDILGGTLSEAAIDQGEKPPRPEDLRVEGFRATEEGGSTTIDASLMWQGDGRYTYEVQITRIT